jgi:hypothetical protein
MAENGKFRRVDVGFKGGAVLGIRLQEDQYKRLKDAIGGSDRWLDLDAEDALVTLDLAEVVYVRLDTERGRVGF